MNNVNKTQPISQFPYLPETKAKEVSKQWKESKSIVFKAEPAPQSGCLHVGMGNFCLDLGMSSIQNRRQMI